MIRNIRFFCLGGFAVLILCSFMGLYRPAAGKAQQENQPPVVKIITPKNNSAVDFGAPVNYQVSVADKEDGNSKYDEINAKEVLLEVRHVAKLPAVITPAGNAEAPAITIMRTSNCFNCHNFNGKAMGPSFYEISKKYTATKANTDTLVKHIREGSSGTWGKEKMPTHKELSEAQIKTTVQWMLQHAADPEVSYYIGLEGSFRIKASPDAKATGAYILTASYLDHGLKTAPGKQRLKSQDVVVIRAK